MATREVTIQIPEWRYAELHQKAERQHRSVEMEIAELVVTATADSESKLSEELQQVLGGLDFFADDDLWRAARSRLPIEASEELEELGYKQQSIGLTPTEKEIQTTLLRQSDQYMLVRAKSAALLKARGYDISVLLQPL